MSPVAASLTLGLGMMACSSLRQATPIPASVAPSRIDTFTVVMPELGGRRRTVRVYVPPGYDAGRARYPVLYLQDGQQVFTPGPYGDWLVDETMDRLVARDPSAALLVVAIDNSEHRWDEYGPWTNAHMFRWVDSSWSRRAEGGEGAAYVAFVANTLKPRIDQRYRTRPDREHTGIGGSSMGGLIALWAGLTRPDVFSKVMAMSSAVWFAEGDGPWLSDNQLLRYLERHPVPAGVRFYLDVGTNERSRDAEPDIRDAEGRAVTYARAYVEGSEAVARALVARGAPAAQVKLVIDEGAIHNESAWSRRFAGAVSWLYQ